MIQQDWQTQRMKNGNQQVKFHSDRAIVHPQQPQTGIISIPYPYSHAFPTISGNDQILLMEDV